MTRVFRVRAGFASLGHALRLARAAVQVDSDKMMVRWGPGADERPWFFVGDEAGYWDGEPDA